MVGTRVGAPAGDRLLRIEGARAGVAGPGGAGLEVFSIRGRRMFELAPIGWQGEDVTYRWPGETAAGGRVPSGIYLAVLRGEEGARAWKVRYVASRGQVTVEGVGFPIPRGTVRPRVRGDGRGSAPAPGLLGDRFADETDTRLPALEDDTARIVAADVDDDDDLDLLIAEFGPNVVRNRLWINDGRGFFTDGTDARLPAIDDFTNDIDAADIDRDGDLDVVVANGIDDDSYILLNDGTGHFTHRPDLLPDSFNESWGVRFCDVTGDSFPDLVFANALGRNRLYLNDGNGAFTDVSETNLPDEGEDTLELCCVDANGDGAVDIVFLNWEPNFGLRNRLLINDGSGDFHDSTATLMPVREEASFDGASADLDGDHLPDLVVADKYLTDIDTGEVVPGTGRNAALVNDSALRPGRFVDGTEARMPALFEWTNGVDVGDVDGENGPDLLFANAELGAGAPNRLYLNNGSGFFSDATAAWLPGASNPSADIVAADLDRDGDLDLVIANFSDGADTVNAEAQNRILINRTVEGIGDGSGTPAGPGLPAAPTLSRNRPNPFNPSTTVEVTIPAGGEWRITLGVYTMRGRLVRVLEDRVLPPGRRLYTWDGRGEDGSPMPSGAYLLRLGANGTVRMRKMLLVK
jgi:hypothetical protein